MIPQRASSEILLRIPSKASSVALPGVSTVFFFSIWYSPRNIFQDFSRSSGNPPEITSEILTIVSFEMFRSLGQWYRGRSYQRKTRRNSEGRSALQSCWKNPIRNYWNNSSRNFCWNFIRISQSNFINKNNCGRNSSKYSWRYKLLEIFISNISKNSRMKLQWNSRKICKNS